MFQDEIFEWNLNRFGSSTMACDVVDDILLSPGKGLLKKKSSISATPFVRLLVKKFEKSFIIDSSLEKYPEVPLFGLNFFLAESSGIWLDEVLRLIFSSSGGSSRVSKSTVVLGLDRVLSKVICGKLKDKSGNNRFVSRGAFKGVSGMLAKGELWGMKI